MMSSRTLSENSGNMLESIILSSVFPPSCQGPVDTRLERDPLGERQVPASAYYGIQTDRAVENFPISGMRAPGVLVTATMHVKKAAAEANVSLGRLAPEVGTAIVRAADEVLGGAFRDQFVVDVYQAGAGTSHNMNANEVLANRAAELLGRPLGSYDVVHPNDHVNMGQSTNDVYPTATRLAILLVTRDLVPAARDLAAAFSRKSEEFRDVLKVGRTHLQDAVPMTLGQELGGYAACLESAAGGVEMAARGLLELNLGATAVGTGLNAGDDYTRLAVAALARDTGLPVVPADNRFRVTQSMGDVLAFSGALRRLAVELDKIASDLRLLSMGPRAGLAEISLPPVQPGSSIMPGKVNPSIPEMVTMVCYQVIGNDAAIAAACAAGAARAERDDARDRLERPACGWHPHDSHAGAARPIDRRTLCRCCAVPRAARAEHRGRDGAQPVPRLRSHGGDCEGVGPDGAADPRSGARARPARRGAAGPNPVGRGDDGTRRRGQAGGAAAAMTRQQRRHVRLTAAAVLAAFIAATPGGLDRVAAQERARHGGLFQPKDLGMLEGPDRDAWQKPDRIMDALGIADGSVVADLGVGGGWFTIRLARRVGPNGIVYAEDIQKEMLEATGRRVGREGLRNVRMHMGLADDPRLPAGKLDAVIILDVYNEMEDPVTLLRNVKRTLKPSGRVGIVDYKMDGGGPGPPLEERVDPEAIVRDARRRPGCGC